MWGPGESPTKLNFPFCCTMNVVTNKVLDTPKISELVLDFQNLIPTMKAIEYAYWDYLDNYTTHNKHTYPGYSFKTFVDIICRKNGKFVNVTDYCSQYDKYKKKIPTAGCIFYHRNSDGLYLTTVMIRQYGKLAKRMFSMPKGKQEDYEKTLLETAIRETWEETGLDIKTLITPETPTIIINKTLFYVIKSDNLVDFSAHQNREIEKVKWTHELEVTMNPDFYSRQVHEAMKYCNGELVLSHRNVSTTSEYVRIRSPDKVFRREWRIPLNISDETSTDHHGSPIDNSLETKAKL